MCTSYPQLSAQVDDFIVSLGDYFDACAGGSDPDRIKERTVLALERLTDTFGTDQYGFNLSIEYFVENLPAGLKAVLSDILAETLPQVRKSGVSGANVAFAACYALSLIYKKEQALEELKALIDRIAGSALMGYPLAYEIRSRYDKRAGDFRAALRHDKQTIKLLEKQGTTNYAVYISFASTICRMYDNGIHVERDQTEDAMEYIDRAINYNPGYAKYHYLKGALLYYSGLDILDVPTFCQRCEAALCHLDDAMTRLHELYLGQGTHFEKELEQYDDLACKIEGERRRRRDAHHAVAAEAPENDPVATQKEEIRASTNSRDVQPRKPELAPGEKYFFISYATADYKAVFCDLVELYVRNVPFVYDETLDSGEAWEEQVRQFMGNKDCCGVVFYISKNALLSAPIETEIRMVTEEFPHLPYFCVNLEGETPPSEILIRTIREHPDTVLRENGVNGRRMRTFLTAFPDNVVYTPRLEKVDSDSSHCAGYMGRLIRQLEKKFHGIRIGAKELATP